MPMINRNQPNSFLSSCAETWEARIEPKMAPGIPDKIKRKAILNRTCLLLECTKTAARDVGIKEARLIPWAICCGVRTKKIIEGIKIVPPPMPIPPIKPDTTPIIKSNIIQSTLSLLQS